MFRPAVSLMLVAAVQVLVAIPAVAEGKSFRLAADADLHASGLLDYLLPRFSLKTAIGIARLPPAAFDPDLFADAPTDLVALAPQDAVGGAALEPAPQVAFLSAGPNGEPGQPWSVVVAKTPPDAPVRVFVDWLLSDIGQNTLTAYRQDDDTAPFLARPELAQPVVADILEGDPVEGEKLALFHCGRCHVVNHRNRMGGIGSTPSFGALRTLSGWKTRFLTFWALNPHPSFTQVKGVTDPFDEAHPPHIAPVEISTDDLEAILAFAATIKPKDLGAEVEPR